MIASPFLDRTLFNSDPGVFLKINHYEYRRCHVIQLIMQPAVIIIQLPTIHNMFGLMRESQIRND